MEPDTLTAAPSWNDYPHIHALAGGAISGAFREWPLVRPEAKAILAELEQLRAELARLKAEITHDPATCYVCLGGR